MAHGCHQGQIFPAAFSGMIRVYVGMQVSINIQGKRTSGNYTKHQFYELKDLLLPPTQIKALF